jgi:hypothetical protein
MTYEATVVYAYGTERYFVKADTMNEALFKLSQRDLLVDALAINVIKR